MKNIKFNVDRPEITSEEIMGKQNFEEVLAGHRFMKKPFYKSSWFIGTAGLASLGLIVGGALSFKLESDVSMEGDELAIVNEGVPPEQDNIIPIGNYLSLTFNSERETHEEIDNEDLIEYDEITTLVDEVIEEEILVPNQEEPVEDVVEEVVESPKKFNRLDLHPRISGRINGNITKEELFDEEGLVTATDVEVVSFELHIIDGSGGRVYVQTGHELSEEMKNSILNAEPGQTIYFEKIRGVSESGVEVGLNPLRYTILR
ncbi:MAG: hypothetical protein MK078_09745 [Crocinitomicaceae bacterium]|nr:hypothetical protein [Crocinitomicaceae bacterium]